MADKHIYRIQFINQDKIYEIYAHSVGPSAMPGFVEIGELAFGERSTVVVDPSEEGLKNEFSGVRRSYIPMHCVIRIDEVDKQGKAKIRDSKTDGNVHPLPLTLHATPKPGGDS